MSHALYIWESLVIEDALILVFFYQYGKVSEMNKIYTMHVINFMLQFLDSNCANGKLSTITLYKYTESHFKGRKYRKNSDKQHTCLLVFRGRFSLFLVPIGIQILLRISNPQQKNTFCINFMAIERVLEGQKTSEIFNKNTAQLRIQ